MKIISSELRQENYINAWQKLKDFFLKANAFSSTNVVKAAQDAVFEANEHLEQWIDKIKNILQYCIGKLSYKNANYSP